MKIGDRIALGIAIVTAIGVIVSIWGFISESKRSRFAMNVELVMRLDERFNGPDMMKKRQKAAQAIVDKSKQNRDLDDVLDFFETTGLLLKKGALEREMVWNTFYYWITGYYQSAVSYISSQAEGDPETYAELKYLYDEMISIEKHRCKCSYSDLVLSDQDIKDFLIDELSD